MNCIPLRSLSARRRRSSWGAKEEDERQGNKEARKGRLKSTCSSDALSEESRGCLQSMKKVDEEEEEGLAQADSNLEMSRTDEEEEKRLPSSASFAIGTADVERAGKEMPRSASNGRLRGAFANMVWSIRNALFLNNALDNNGESNNNNKAGISHSQSATINRREYNKLSTVENEDDEDDLIDPPPLTPDEILMDYDVQDSEDEESDRSNLWDDEELTCNVCDRAFGTPRLLERHQQKRRHWGCNTCDILCDSYLLLEQHKEENEHWSETDQDDDSLDELDVNENWDYDQVRRFRRLCRRQEYQETEFGSDIEDKAMLI